MENKRSIDIIIPSFRLHESILLDIIALPHPPAFQVAIYIIADNPKVIVPESIRRLADEGRINLLINSSNLGVAATRNKGIMAGNGKWALLLDDDIKPRPDLLTAYAAAIVQNEDAMGFAGVTDFPAPFNAVTTALEISGATGHFKAARHQGSMIWAPTANLLLNKQKMAEGLFDAGLKKSGEDIDFLVRNSLLFGEKYIAVPDAVVLHPWWDEGGVQTRRMVRYGEGASEIARKAPVKNYTYRDFTNTSETLLLLLLCLPVFVFSGYGGLAVAGIIALLTSEFATNWLKGIIAGKTASPAVAFHLMWAKNCWEFGFLYASLTTGYLNGFAQRIEMGFVKPHPSPFRLNRWKIIKILILLALLSVYLVAVGAGNNSSS